MQLLVRVVDKISKDPDKNIQLTKRGDVIVIKKDGEEWGIEELKNPDWRIISVPDMTELEARALLSPENPPLDNPNAPVAKRAFRLNLDSDATLKSICDSARDVSVPADKLIKTDIATDVSMIRSLKEMKPISADPKVIG